MTTYTPLGVCIIATGWGLTASLEHIPHKLSRLEAALVLLDKKKLETGWQGKDRWVGLA